MENVYVYKQEKPELFNTYFDKFNLIHSYLKGKNLVTTHYVKYVNQITETSPVTVYVEDSLYKSYQIKNDNTTILLIDNFNKTI